MKLKCLFFAVAALVFLPQAYAANECTLRNSGCFFDESCVFSMFAASNAHASGCGSAYTYNICCKKTFIPSGCSLRPSCLATESGIASLYLTTNAHAEMYMNTTYANQVCCPKPGSWDKIACSYKTSCSPAESALASMYNYTNAHVGNTTAYSNLICCRLADETAPKAIVAYPSVAPSSSIRFDVSCTDSGGSPGCSTTRIKTATLGECSVAGASGNCSLSLPACETDTYSFDTNATDLAGNSNYTAGYGNFEVKKDDGCGCTENSQCYSGACAEGFCGPAGTSQLVMFAATGTQTLELGKTGNININVRNPTSTAQSIPLYIGSFDVIRNWVWFDGQKYDSRRQKTIVLEPRAEKAVIVKVLAGKTGDYSLSVGPNNDYAQRYDEIKIRIISKDSQGLFSETPGLELWSFVIIALAGGLAAGAKQRRAYI